MSAAVKGLAPSAQQLRVLQCVRVLLRDTILRQLLCSKLDGTNCLAKLFQSYAELSFVGEDSPLVGDTLVELGRYVCTYGLESNNM